MNKCLGYDSSWHMKEKQKQTFFHLFLTIFKNSPMHKTCTDEEDDLLKFTQLSLISSS